MIKPGDIIKIEKIEKPKGEIIEFDKVLLVSAGEEIKLGNPYLDSAKITGKWLEEGRAKKITILRYHSKTRYTKKKGHRQIYTKVQIENF